MMTNKPSPPADEPEGKLPSMEKGPNCWDCRFLGITWNPRTPYSCKLMGFRSRMIPSLEVLRADGMFCMGFMPKVIPIAQAPATPVTQTPAVIPRRKKLTRFLWEA
jgi:hypothetical protein